MSLKCSSVVTEIELRYKNKVPSKNRPKIQSSKDAYEVFIYNWRSPLDLLEEFNILLLDQSNRVMAISRHSKGGITGTVVDVRLAFATALKGRATSLILAHNHPSCNLKPSNEDIRITERFKEAGKFLDIAILDHLILSSEGRYYSFADEGCVL